MENQDHLSDFLGNLAEKIKTAKEHKNIMEAVYASASATEVVKEQEDPFVNFLHKVGDAVSSKLPKKEVLINTTENIEPVIEATQEAATQLGNKIRQALEQAKKKPKKQKPIVEDTKVQPEVKVEPNVEPEDENKSAKDLAQKIRDAIEKAKNRALEQPTTQPEEPKQEEDNQIASYIEELEKIKDTGTEEQKEEATTSLKELKKYIDKTVQDYARRILDLGGGGGSVAVQYAKGGTMDGTLNVTGNILSGGRNISDYFGSGGGGGDPAVNTVVYTNSGNWNSTYTTVNTYSGTWSTGIQDLAFDEDTALLSISYGNTVSLSALSGSKGSAGDPAVNTAVYTGSANWNSNYTTTNYFSAFWNAAVDELFNFFVTQTDPGSAFISEDGNYYIIANSKLDNVDLWNTAYTQMFLLSSSWSSVYVTVLGASARWESTYTSLNQNSARYESVYTTTQVNSASWSSVYNTYKSLSASYAAETLAIAYAVAL